MIALVASRFRASTIAIALILAGAAALSACGFSSPSPAGAEAFGWLHPGAPPSGWQRSPLPDGSATLAYPPGWRAIRSDPGTVTAALRARDGEIRGYLNATPQQGEETLANWGSFRTEHNGEEGDEDIRTLASASGLPFPAAHGSCVIDAYTSSSGHDYREIACLVAGRSATTFVVGAAPPADWGAQGPALERAVSSFQT